MASGSMGCEGGLVSPPQIQPLDPRRFLSVTVSEGYPGFFDIESDGASDSIHVAVSQQNHTFTLDGVTYSDVAYIEVHGGGGDDDIVVQSTDGSGDIGAGVSGDDGNDSITLNFDGGVWGGNGDDTLYLSDSFYGVADGGAGNDSVYVLGSCVSADIEGGDGNDLLDGTMSDLGLTLHGGLGDDTIMGSAYDDEIYGDGGRDMLFGNAGNDTFYAADGSGCHINGGSGTDICYANGSEASITNVEYVFT